MLQKDLATALDISPAMVSKLFKRGMPTDTVERAQRDGASGTCSRAA